MTVERSESDMVMANDIWNDWSSPTDLSVLRHICYELQLRTKSAAEFLQAGLDFGALILRGPDGGGRGQTVATSGPWRG
jgi:hypothetical protein